MTNTKQKGDITELQCLTEFAKMGYICNIPYGDNARYDILVDTGKEIIKVQCKTAIYDNENKSSFTISCKSTNISHGKWIQKRYDKTQIDVFATYINETMYIIPVEEVGTSITLRLSESKNNQLKNIKYARDYTAQNFFNNYDVYLDGEQRTCEPKHYKCIICGAPVYEDNSMCVICANKTNRKVERPSREDLKKLIRTKSFWQISKDFGVSDVMVHKWCKWSKLPYRKRDIREISDEDWEKI